MADTPTGETVTPEAPSNETGNTNIPTQVNVSADVEAAKKEAEQAIIRANQLANENAKLKAEQEAIQRKQLEEKEEFKTLYEQTNARLAEIEAEKTENERKSQLASATDTVFKDYPANVVELARTAGLGLSDDSEEAVSALKEKLDIFKKQVVPTATPSANNPHNPVPADATNEELYGRMRGDNLDVSRAATRQFIAAHPAIKRMKEIANGQY